MILPEPLQEIQLNGPLRLSCVTGKVLDTASRTEVETSETRYENTVEHSSRASITDTIFLRERDGSERVVQLENFHFPARKDNIVRLLFAKRPDTDKGLYLYGLQPQYGKAII